MTPVRKKATYQDIENLPAHVTGEIIAGELVVMPRPSGRHTKAASFLGAYLLTRFGDDDGPGRWWILHEPELHLGKDQDWHPLVPDLAGWKREHMPVVPESHVFSTSPDWVCEVLSPSTGAYDRADKLPFYARQGVGHIWILDPIAKTLEVFVGDRGSARLLSTHRKTARANVAPFEELELKLDHIWGAD